MWLTIHNADRARRLRVHRLIPFGCLLVALVGRLATTALVTLPAQGVILISIDTLRADRLGAYGYPLPTSPVLDRFASEGTRFATCIATSPWTLPSHLSMLTGLYPARHGAVHLRRPLQPGVRLVSEELRDRGFRTAAIVAADIVLPDERCRGGFDHYEELPWRDDDAAHASRILNTGAGITAAATSWLENLTPNARFFLFIHYYDVHSDYAPEPRFRALLDAAPNLDVGSSSFLIRHREGATLTAMQRRQIQRLYDAEIRQLDAHLGTFFEALQRLRLWNQTLIVVTSDHGEEFQEHGRLLHGRALYEETMHVPLLMRGPGVPRGRVITRLTSQVDITPTILAATGTPITERLDGASLLPLLAGMDADRPDFVVGGATHFGGVRMVRTPRFKLIDHHNEADELYDLVEDPEERTNIIARDHDRRAQMADRLASIEGGAPNNPVEQLSVFDRERLRALGYLD